MPYAIVSQDLPDRCPTFRAKPRERVQPVLMRLAAPQKQVQVRVLSGRVLGVSHRMVMFAEAPSAEAIRAFAMGAAWCRGTVSRAIRCGALTRPSNTPAR
jgi:hypothetical protein